MEMWLDAKSRDFHPGGVQPWQKEFLLPLGRTLKIGRARSARFT